MNRQEKEYRVWYKGEVYSYIYVPAKNKKEAEMKAERIVIKEGLYPESLPNEWKIDSIEESDR